LAYFISISVRKKPCFNILAAALLLAALALSHASWAGAGPISVPADETTPRVDRKGVSSSLHLPQGDLLRLNYSFSQRVLRIGRGKSLLALVRVEKDKNPERVGMESYIRLLPLDLQPYLSNNKVLFLSAERSRANNGMGQCGAGAEVYLHALDLEPSPPRLVSSVLIGSCFESIEMVGGESGTLNVHDTFSVENQRLRIQFSSHKSREERTPIGVLSTDLTTLLFE
jgi:hypothetical protein